MFRYTRKKTTLIKGIHPILRAEKIKLIKQIIIIFINKHI